MNTDLNTLALVIIAVCNAFVAWVAWRTKIAAEKTETNTNHMREQLVEASGKVEHAKGVAQGRAEKRKP